MNTSRFTTKIGGALLAGFAQSPGLISSKHAALSGTGFLNCCLPSPPELAWHGVPIARAATIDAAILGATSGRPHKSNSLN